MARFQTWTRPSPSSTRMPSLEWSTTACSLPVSSTSRVRCSAPRSATPRRGQQRAEHVEVALAEVGLCVRCDPLGGATSTRTPSRRPSASSGDEQACGPTRAAARRSRARRRLRSGASSAASKAVSSPTSTPYSSARTTAPGRSSSPSRTTRALSAAKVSRSRPRKLDSRSSATSRPTSTCERATSGPMRTRSRASWAAAR